MKRMALASLNHRDSFTLLPTRQTHKHTFKRIKPSPRSYQDYEAAKKLGMNTETASKDMTSETRSFHEIVKTHFIMSSR